jgi:hypothetical protein
MARYTETILVPVTPEMAATLRRLADRDARSVAAYVRVLLAAALAKSNAA